MTSEIVLTGAQEEQIACSVQPEEIILRFAEWMRLDVADGNALPETLRAYACDVRQYLTWLVSNGIVLTDVTHEILKHYRADLVEQHAVSTVGRKLVAVRRFHEMAHARNVLSTNPGARLKSPADRTNRVERIQYLRGDVVRALLQAPVDMYPRDPRGTRDRAMLTLMAIHGLRVIEVHRLNMVDFDSDAESAGTLRLFGKGSKYRTVLLTEATRAVLDAWLETREALSPVSDALFVTLHWGLREGEKPNHCISRRSIRSMVDGYMERLGVKRPGISCHALRHSFATLSLANGASLMNIGDALGHADYRTTMVYAHIVDRDANNPARTLTALVPTVSGGAHVN